MSPALVAVAHGSRDPSAQRETARLLEEVRRLRPGLSVEGAYLDHARPTLAEALDVTPDAVVVPLLLGDGYHSAADIPATIRASRGRPRQTPVLGDVQLLPLLERRLAEAGVPAGDATTAVVLAAAGSTSSVSITAVQRLATAWADRGWWAVRPAFASAARPSVEESVRSLRADGAPRVVVSSYLMFHGRFFERLQRCGAEVVAAPLGPDPSLARLVLDRYDEAAGAGRIPSTP